MGEKELSAEIKKLEKQMMAEAKNLEFEKAAATRDKLNKIKEMAFGARTGGWFPLVLGWVNPKQNSSYLLNLSGIVKYYQFGNLLSITIHYQGDIWDLLLKVDLQ